MEVVRIWTAARSGCPKGHSDWAKRWPRQEGDTGGKQESRSMHACPNNFSTFNALTQGHYLLIHEVKLNWYL